MLCHLSVGQHAANEELKTSLHKDLKKLLEKMWQEKRKEKINFKNWTKTEKWLDLVT